jgi:beta-N-acetylhexosaminidase
VDAERPPIIRDLVPFDEARVDQMRRYAVRHYGLRTALLKDPKVVVQHYTASTSYSSAWNTFAANAPDVEFGERPGVCAHFLIDRRGRIHQLVPLRYMCRHTVGLNHVAIGIEHVGTSDAAVMGVTRVRRASLRLTRWLVARHGIAVRNVIGHSESLSSPYHRERVAAFKGRTHSDMSRSTMTRYRRLLRNGR